MTHGAKATDVIKVCVSEAHVAVTCTINDVCNIYGTDTNSKNNENSICVGEAYALGTGSKASGEKLICVGSTNAYECAPKHTCQLNGTEKESVCLGNDILLRCFNVFV